MLRNFQYARTGATYLIRNALSRKRKTIDARCLLPGPGTNIVDGNCVRETLVKTNKKYSARNNAKWSKHFSVFMQCTYIRQVPRKVLKTSACGLGFQHLPRDLMNVNTWKTMFDPYINKEVEEHMKLRGILKFNLMHLMHLFRMYQEHVSISVFFSVLFYFIFYLLLVFFLW